MRHLLKTGLLYVAAVAATLPSPAATAAETEQTLDELEQVLVTGERPGPALWKVTRKGSDHVLWIMPTFEPLPDSLVLRSAQLERVISESQAVHFIRSMRFPRSIADGELAKRAVANPPGKRLRDVVSPELHAQFRDMADQFASGSEMIENMRPVAAAEWLKQMAMKRLQLTDRSINLSVNALAVKHAVQTTGVRWKEEEESWGRMLEKLDRIPREADARCAKALLDNMEKELRNSVRWANAWSRGDITALRNDEELEASQKGHKACEDYGFFRYTSLGTVQQPALRRHSYKTGREALGKNQSTLMLVPLSELFDRSGLVRRLKRAGYKLEEPPSLPDPSSEE